MTEIISFIIHIDSYMLQIVNTFGSLSYLIVFLIVFVETGLVVVPFLPGDSLIFVVGAFASKGAFNIFIVYPMLILAAVFGDALNYYIGHKIGRKAFNSKKVPFINHEHLEKTEAFYEKHGGKTIILARFIPIIRTFAPFVAGIGKMSYRDFLNYNIIGGIAWVTIFLLAGYFFGNIPFIEKNFSLVIIAVIFISILPPIVQYVREHLSKK